MYIDIIKHFEINMTIELQKNGQIINRQIITTQQKNPYPTPQNAEAENTSLKYKKIVMRKFQKHNVKIIQEENENL